MKLNEYCEYIRDPLAEAKARVVIVPPGESWTVLRRFYQERGFEVRISDLVMESAWLPMPEEIFGRIYNSMTEKKTSGKDVVLIGMPGYLALLTDENKRAAIYALRGWVDSIHGREAVCLFRGGDDTELILKDVFINPRYRQGRQLIKIRDENFIFTEAERIDGSPEVMLVGEDLVSFIPEACDTFQKYLRFMEEHPNDESVRRIVVASEGHQLPGLSADVRQVVCLRDFACVFYDIDDGELSEDAILRVCEKGKEGYGKIILEIFKKLFFPEGEITKNVLRIFDKCKDTEREMVFWLLKRVAPKESYLERIVKHEGIGVDNFRSGYVIGAAQWLENVEGQAEERRYAILEADVKMSAATIRQFITSCLDESTSRVAPWLNCGTDAERAELLRRCREDGIVANIVKDVYPEVEAYLNRDFVFEDQTLEEYFREYRELKMAGRVTAEFYEKALHAVLPTSVQSRNKLLQNYASDDGCALLVVDAMGAEWLPMLTVLARQRNIGIDSISVSQACLPTTTFFNKIHWPDVARRLPDIKRFDNIVHNGVEAHETRPAEENLVAALKVIDDEVLPRVAEGLTLFERVLVTADHGSSRLSVLAWQSKLARTLSFEDSMEIADWRYRKSVEQEGCPPELEETLEGEHWVVRGYNRLPKKGGGQGFELHGGATLEERLVPVVIFSKAGDFVPRAKVAEKRAQIVEKDDFDL
jgi:hypothetical protein